MTERKCSSIPGAMDINYGHLMKQVTRGKAVKTRAALLSTKDQDDGSTMVAEKDEP